MKLPSRFPWIPVLLGLFLTACASATPENHYDPLEKVNRGTDTFNTKLDNVTLKPLAVAYRDLTPKFMRTGFANFFDNITYLDTILNDFLQGKGAQGMQDFGRFLANTTLGIGGLIDVATPMGLEKHKEDFGQTLAVWGASQGAYLVYPVLGPSSVRDTPGIAVSTATSGLFWAGLFLAPQVTIPITVLHYVDKRSQLLGVSSMRDELALDPYVFTREAWHQNREYLIYDGNPPQPAPVKDDGWQEDPFDD